MPKYLEAKSEALRELITQHRHRYLNIPCLMGGVGIGKTEMAADLSVEVGEVIGDELLFEAIATGEASDPTDTSGIPWVIQVDDPTSITKKDYKVLWALNRAAYQACKVPTMLLFDDIDKATPIVINALLNLFVHRRFKDFELHPNSLMMAAGNRSIDDKSANELSESIRTRITIIEVEASLADFAKYATEVPDGTPSKIDPLILGFLAMRPELLHKHEEGVYRFPTPRGYRETTLQMREFPDDKTWKRLMERKIGVAAANDFWNYYSILRFVDVDYILDNGALKERPKSTEKLPQEVADKMGQFAAVFAVTQRLNQEVKPGWNGLERFVDSLGEELRVAFLLQLREKMKTDFRKYYKNAAGKIMATIIKDAT